MIDLDNHPRTPRHYARLFFTGTAMGIADLIPGVSGGTMAFILGVYEDLLKAIKSFNLELLSILGTFNLRQAMQHVPWQFLLALFLGIGSAVFALANLMEWLLENQRIYLFAFFFGLILASILAIGAKIKWTLTTGFALVAGAIFAFLVVNLPFLQDPPHNALTLFFSGMIAIMAMILPGISGSFILLILGQYDYVLSAVSNLQILTLLPVAAGSIIGLLAFSRVLSWLLQRYHNPTIAVLVGFMIGSLSVIWPWKVVVETRIDRHGEEVPALFANVLPDFAASQFWLALALCFVGFLLVSWLDHLQSRSNPIFRLGRGRQRDIAPQPTTDG